MLSANTVKRRMKHSFSEGKKHDGLGLKTKSYDPGSKKTCMFPSLVPTSFS